MSFLLSSVCRSVARNTVLARHSQNLTRIAVSHQIQLNKFHNKFETAKLDAKLIRSFSNSAPEAVSAAHDHTKLWTLERGISAALIAVIPLALITRNPYLDYALALSLVTHVHWGLEAIVVDYVRPIIFGPVIPKLAVGLTYLLSILSLAGIYYFNYSDVGLAQAIMMLLKK